MLNLHKKILVRVDGSKSIGLGHVYNMITVLSHIKNAKILILMKLNSDLGITKFKKHNLKVRKFSTKKQLVEEIENFQPDIIFNDILNTTVSYMKSLKKFNSLIVNFEDLGPGRKYANLVFNPIYYTKKSLKNEFYGHDYACVRKEFCTLKSKPITKNVKKIVITFGGTDPADKTLHVLKTLFKLDFIKIEINVILGLGYSNRKQIRNLADQMKLNGFNVKIIERADDISKYVKNSDFAITSNGRTVFEIAAMKIPMISIAVNARERQHSFVRYSKCGFHLDTHSNLDETQLLQLIKKMMRVKTRQKFRENLDKNNLIEGVDRVLEIIENKK